MHLSECTGTIQKRWCLGLGKEKKLPALFFGSVLPLAVKWESRLVMPDVYGGATGLPVLLFTGLFAIGTQKVTQTYNRVIACGR